MRARFVVEDVNLMLKGGRFLASRGVVGLDLVGGGVDIVTPLSNSMHPDWLLPPAQFREGDYRVEWCERKEIELL